MVAFVLCPGITLLDMVGPLQVFSVLQGFNDQYRPVDMAEPVVTQWVQRNWPTGRTCWPSGAAEPYNNPYDPAAA